MGIFRQFPYSNFHDMNMDEIIKICRELQDAWDATSAEWASYKDFIDNYFANLDVSAEVLEALRALAADGTLGNIVDPKIASYTAAWLEAHITTTAGETVIDNSLTIRNAAADAMWAGDYIYHGISDTVEHDKKHIHIDLENGFWSTTNGNKYDNPADSYYRRSPYRLRVEPGSFYYADIDCEAVLFDVNRNVIGSRPIRSIDTLKTVKPSIIPDNVYYIAINMPRGTVDDITEVNLTLLNSDNVSNITYPFDDEKYLYLENTFANQNGSLSSVTTLNVIMLAGTNLAGKKFYVSNTAGNQCICINTNGNVLDPNLVSDPYSNGQIGTVPEGTRLLYFNIYKSHTDTSGTELTDYISEITTTNKILCIGDSVTWLDGVSSGGATQGKGYQKELRLLGYEVDKRAWSGNPFTVGINTEDPTASIYRHVVTDQLDVSGYKYIILFGGLNDMLYNAPLGSAPTDYTDRNFDPETFAGAISGIVSYIREHNTTAAIIMVNCPKSEALSRIYTKALTYINKMNECAEYWSLKVVDLFKDMNVSPTYENFDNFFYDVTHPNQAGFRRMGNIIANAIIDYDNKY